MRIARILAVALVVPLLALTFFAGCHDSHVRRRHDDFGGRRHASYDSHRGHGPGHAVQRGGQRRR